MRIYTSRDGRYWCETTGEKGLYKLRSGHVTFTMHYRSDAEAVNVVKKARAAEVRRMKRC